MHIEFDLNSEQTAHLTELAARLGIDPAELVRNTCIELLSRPADDFLNVAKKVLEKNRELYRRLA